MSYNRDVDMLDILAVTGLEWLYDRVEGRYGRVAALLVTTATALAVLGVAIWLLLIMLRLAQT